MKSITKIWDISSFGSNATVLNDWINQSRANCGQRWFLIDPRNSTGKIKFVKNVSVTFRSNLFIFFRIFISLCWVSTVPGELCQKIAVSNPTQADQRFTWSKTWCDRQQLWKAVITGDTVTRLIIPIRRSR